MDKYEETFETWNKIATLYQDKFMKLDLYNDTYDYICSSISKQGAKVLEIGCGPGNITKYLLSKRPDFDIFGIDIAPNMIDLAKKNNPSANFEVMDNREIYSLKTKYDGIISGFCLPYLSDTEAIDFISQAYELLNENGLLYMSFVEGKPEESGYKVGGGGRVYFHFHILEHLKEQLVTRKFEEIETFKVAFPRSESETEIHTILIARKFKNQ